MQWCRGFTSGVQFGLCSIRIFFLSFFILFFRFLLIFSLTDIAIHGIAGKGKVILIFYNFHSLTNIQLVYQDFYHFSLEIYILFAFSLIQLSWRYWLWHFIVILWDLSSYQTITLLLQSKRLLLQSKADQYSLYLCCSFFNTIYLF